MAAGIIAHSSPLQRSMIPRRIGALGGSNVHGQGDPQGGGFIGRLRAWHEARDPANRLFNLGVGGDRVREMAKRAFLETEARRLELILLYPGFNDIRRLGSPGARRTDLSEYRGVLSDLAAGLSKSARVVLLTGIPIDEARTCPCLGSYYFVEQDAAEFSRATCELAAELGLPCFDIFGEWQKKPARRELLADGLHCTPEGHALLAEELRDFLLRLFGDTD
jgi:lysophospholipase L1-like esterase